MPGVSAQPGCVAVTEMPSVPPAVLEHRQQLDLGALAAGVGGGRRVVAGEVLGVVVAQPLPVHPARGHQHHPPVGEPGTQQVGHQHRAEHVQRHRQLVALLRLGALGRHGAGVVHEDVEVRQIEPVDEAADVVEVADVAAVDHQVGAGDAGGERAAYLLALGGVADHQPHLRAEPGQALRGRQPEPGGGTGDRGDPAAQCVRGGVGRPGREAAAESGPEPRVAGGHGAVEEGVEAFGDREGQHAATVAGPANRLCDHEP